MLIEFARYIQFLPEFIIAFISSLLLTPLIGYIADKFHLLDLTASQRNKNDPTAWRRIHTEPKVIAGGIAVIIPFLIIIIITAPHTKYLIGLISGVLLLLLCGIIDDFFNLSAKIQAFFHIIAAILVVASGLEIVTISNPFGRAISLQFLQITIHGSIRFIPAALITIIWIFFTINAMKWVAGTDGLVEGMSFLSAITIGLISVRFQTYSTAIMSFTFAGAMLGLLYFNFYPSKILSGSSGKSVYGFILALLAIYSGGKLATFFLVLSLPILDAIWVIFYRIRVHKPKSLFQLFSINDKSHIHHKLLDLGLNQRQVALLEYSYTATMGVLAFLLTGMYKAFSLLIVLIFLCLMYIFISYLLKKRKESVI